MGLRTEPKCNFHNGKLLPWHQLRSHMTLARSVHHVFQPKYQCGSQTGGGMVYRGNPGHRSNWEGNGCEREVVMRGSEEHNSCWAPAIEEPPQTRLFRIVGDMWSESIDRTAEVSIRTSHDIGGRHERPQWEKNRRDRPMCQVSLETSEFLRVSVLPGTCQRSSSYC